MSQSHKMVTESKINYLIRRHLLKNKYLNWILITLITASMIGCNSQPVSESTTNEEPTTVTEEPISENTEDESQAIASEVGSDTVSTTTELKRVGKDNYGYLSVPENWVNFKDVDVTIPIVQVSDPTGTSIITLNTWNTEESTAELSATSLWNKLEEEGVKDVTGAKVPLDIYSAFQVYGFYETENTILIMWLFDTDDGNVHYVSAESTPETIMDVVQLVESSFSLEQ